MSSIYSKLLSIRKEVSFVKVRKPGVNYPVLDGDTLLEMVGNALAKHDIVFIPSMIDAQVNYVEIKQKMVQHALATIEMVFIDTETGDTFTATTHGSGQSYDGKALGIAQTYGIKYFFYRMFLKGESDIDDEATEPTPTPRQQSAPEPPPSDLGETTDVVWTRNERDEVLAFVEFAIDEWEQLGMPTKSISHAYNRLANVLGLPNVAGKKQAFYDAIAAHYTGSKQDAADAVRGYTEATES